MQRCSVGYSRKYTQNSQICEMQKQRKDINQKKQSHKTVFTWFGNFPASIELQEFHYSQRKIQDMAQASASWTKPQKISH